MTIAQPPRDINRIHGLSDRRRLPRLGKIRLGVKSTSKNGEIFPTETNYFVVPIEVERIYGKQPQALTVMFPVDDIGQIFPQAYKCYTTSGLKCKGDGKNAIRRWIDVDPTTRQKIGKTHQPYDLVEIPCPCPALAAKACSVKASLMVLLPEVSLSGVYQIDTGSAWNLVELNSSIEYLQALLGRISMIPLTLKRVPIELTWQGKKRVHHLLKLTFDGGMGAVRRIREMHRHNAPLAIALPAPDEGQNGHAECFDDPETPSRASSTDADREQTPHDRQGEAVSQARVPTTTATPTKTIVEPPAPEPTRTTSTLVPPTESSEAPRVPGQPESPSTQAAAQSTPPTTQLSCACGTTVTKAVATYSTRYFDEVVCMPCQKKRFAVRRGSTAESEAHIPA